MLPAIEERLARELGARIAQVAAAIELLDDGATVPFIARYRKEATGGLDDTQLRLLDERLVYLRELEARRTAILASIDEQGKLTPELRAEVEDADTKQRLEDLYLPYKPKRRTKAQIAREAGLEPLAMALLADPTLDPETEGALGLARQAVAASGTGIVRRSLRARRGRGHPRLRRNLKDLLLAAPAGPKAVIGLDPGIRTGVKVAVVDRTGKLLDTATIYPHEPRNDWDGSLHALAQLARSMAPN
jgi:transcriptional accessory protein Tex/SPT6